MRHAIPVWQMVQEAVEALGGSATLAQITDYVRSKHGDVKPGTISLQTHLCTVNMPSRVNFSQNATPRIAHTKYDYLFSRSPGQYELYKPEKHGLWEIRRSSKGKLVVARVEPGHAVGSSTPSPSIEANQSTAMEICEGADDALAAGTAFPLESHLRDFIAKNIASIRVNDRRLRLYTDQMGTRGVEYATPVGNIDVLAVDEAGDFVAFELKLSQGHDRSIGQLLRYIGWVQTNLAQGRKVTGAIVAEHIDKKLRYAAATVPHVALFEYQVNFNIRQVGLSTERDAPVQAAGRIRERLAESGRNFDDSVDLIREDRDR